ncbi:MAG: MATE family efflux transporter [Phycisphaerales bacterium]
MTQRRVEEIELQDPDLGHSQAAVAEIERRATIPPDSEGRIRSGRLAGLSMWQAIFVLSWPVLIEAFLNACVGLVDTTLAAGLSEAATDAIGVAAYFNWFVSLIAMSLGVGATAMISRAMGRGRVAVANAALGQTMLLGLVLGILACIAITFAAPLIATVLRLEGDAVPYAITYLRIAAVGIPGVTVLFAGIACCRGAGDAFRPMLTMIAVNIINIGLSFALAGVDIARSTLGPDGEVVNDVILANPFPWEMGIEGIAIGTLVAWLAGGVIMLGILIRGTHGLRLMRRRLKPHLHTMRRLVKVAAPNFVETFGMWFGNFLTIMMVGGMGAGFYGAHVVAVRVEAFSFLPGFAMSTAAATLAGQYLGAGSVRLARLAVIRCTMIAAAIMSVFGVAFLTIPDEIVGVFSQQPTHLEHTPQLLMVCGMIQIPFAIAIVVRGALRGAGDTYTVMILTWTSTYAIRLPLAWLFSGIQIPLWGDLVLPNPAPLQTHFDIHPLTGLWCGLCGELGIRFCLFLGRFIHGGWTRRKV